MSTVKRNVRRTLSLSKGASHIQLAKSSQPVNNAGLCKRHNVRGKYLNKIT